MTEAIFLNGAFVAETDAKISVLDRGFIFGDGVYEVIAVYDGQAFRLGDHLNRLKRSLGAIGMQNPYPQARWTDIVNALIERSMSDSLFIYLQVTRGTAPRNHSFPASPSPTIFAMTNPMPPADGRWLEQGVHAVTRQDFRWSRCDIKSVNLLPNVMLRQEADEVDAAEAILIRNGVITEGAATNVFAVVDGIILTPPEGPHILSGITRQVILELAGRHALPFQETPIPQATLTNADEIWLSSTSKEVIAVTRLNDGPVGTGLPGPVWAQVHTLFQDHKSSP